MLVKIQNWLYDKFGWIMVLTAVGIVSLVVYANRMDFDNEQKYIGNCFARGGWPLYVQDWDYQEHWHIRTTNNRICIDRKAIIFEGNIQSDFFWRW